MKITICGSITFAQNIVNIFQELKNLGHQPILDEKMFLIAAGDFADPTKKEDDVIKTWYNFIVGSDAVLICNFNKNGIANYIGGNTLMEIGFAFVNNKKIFLLNPIPTELSYNAEIVAMKPIILNGDLEKIHNS